MRYSLTVAIHAAASKQYDTMCGMYPDMSQLDAVDRRILEILQDDARITNRALADRVGLSPSACLARVKALRERGVIRRYAAELDLSVLGRPLQALVAIRLVTHDRSVLDRIVADLVALPETVSLFHLTGEADYLLHVAVSDPDHLRDLVLDELTSRREIGNVNTSLVFQHHRPDLLGTAPPRRSPHGGTR